MFKKISMFLAVMMLVVAMFAVPTMAADTDVDFYDSSASFLFTDEELRSGEIITKSSNGVEIEMQGQDSKGRGVVQTGNIKGTNKRGGTSSDHYGYLRTRYTYDLTQNAIFGMWEPPTENGNPSRGIKGDYSYAEDIGYQRINSSSFVQNANFYDRGFKVWTKTTLAAKNWGIDTGVDQRYAS